VVADGRKPHIMGGRITGGRDSTGAEAVAMILARNSARRWLRRHGLRAELLVVCIPTISLWRLHSSRGMPRTGSPIGGWPDNIP